MAEALLLLREDSVSLKMCKGEPCTGDGNTLRFPRQERLKLVTLLRHSCVVVLSWDSWKGTGIFICLPDNKFVTVKLITEFSRNNLSVWTDSVFHFDIHLTFSFLHVLRVLHHLPEKKNLLRFCWQLVPFSSPSTLKRAAEERLAHRLSRLCHWGSHLLSPEGCYVFIGHKLAQHICLRELCWQMEQRRLVGATVPAVVLPHSELRNRGTG